MKQTFTHSIAALLLTALGLLAPNRALAQDDIDVTGWANVHITVKAAPVGGGKVFPYWKESAVKAWRDEWDFKQSVPVGTLYDVPFTMIYLYAQPNSDDNYILAGWYLDDGDGVFDITKDELLGDSEEFIIEAAIDESATIYDTQAAAKNGTYPETATDLVWAYFTRGARVGMSWYQGDTYSHFGNCGSVWMSKEVNEPGDEITIRAIANDGYHFAYWQDADYQGNIVSRENPFTFTVKGGEHYYAYFIGDDAPSFDLPEEGGFTVANINASWLLSDESLKDGAQVLVMESEDMKRTADGKVYLDMTSEDCQINVSQWQGCPSLIYGKGHVQFSVKLGIGFGRNGVGYDLLKWSGAKGVTVRGDVIYVYIFVPELGAFIQYGTTDDFNPAATPTVEVPAGVAYFTMSAFDLTDDQGNIPTVIGLSPETYDQGVAGGNAALQHFLEQVAEQLGIADVQPSATSLGGQRVYTLSGLQVKTTTQKGIYIVNGRKVAVK